ncbi:TonB-dependent receptor [Sphingobacterium gobiense]|nr:TonB-dependent receptor [Sphingobacterium gobiense]
MKLVAMLLLFTLSTATASSYGQQNITLKTNHTPLGNVLKNLENQVDYYFVYRESEIKGISIDQVQLKNVPLTKALNEILEGTNIVYNIVGKNIVLKKVSAVAAPAIQQQVAGTVVNDLGEALIGATVVVRGKTLQTQTDVNGAFQLTGVEKGDVLVVSYIGHSPGELIYDGQTQLSITLNATAGDLDEVVVVGYGTQKKINLTGAVGSISGEDLESRPITNVGRGLQGQIPGLTVRGENTAPGAQAPKIRIRGVGTWGDAEPLIVIDGVPGGNMNILNPDDIESISVLKDAASSSIYGVRGANGVILVTTKKGTSGSPTLSMSSYVGWQTPTALPKFLGSPDYMMLQNEANINAGQNPTYTEEQIEIARNGSDPNYFANTDWIDEVYRKSAPQQNYNLSLQGGHDKTSYYASYGYLGEGGLVVGDNFKAGRHNARLRLNTEVFDRIKLDGNLGYVDRGYDGSASGTSPLSAAISIRPLVPVRFTNGSWGYHGGQSNPVAWAQDGGTDSFTSQEITANIAATINLFEGLDLRGQYGLVKYNSKRNKLLKTIHYFSPDDNELIYRTNYPNSMRMDHYAQTYQTFIATAHYNKTILDNHNITGLLGYSLEETVGNDFWGSRQRLASQDLPSLEIGTENQLNGSSSNQNALMSFFGRVNYDYNSKYLLEGNFRYDGSSRFHPDVRWNWFGSFSAGWVFSEEDFFEDLKGFWNLGKVRFSYGTQGNDKVMDPNNNSVRDFPYLLTLAPSGVTSNNPIGDQERVGFRQSYIPNPQVTWESAEKTNIGLDLAFLSNRLNVTADYFINNTNDILLARLLPDVIGVGTNYPAYNLGSIQNKGWEVVLGWQDNIGEVRYGANFNLSDVRNKVTHLEDRSEVLNDQVRLVGHPIGAFYGFIADRIAQESDFDIVNGEYIPKFPYQRGDLVAPGDLIYKPSDPNATEITVQNDRHILGSDIPRYTYGFRGDLAYKGFDFSFFLQGVGKADGYLAGSARHPFINNSAMPQEVHLDRWTPDNTDASYPRFVYLRTHNTRMSSKWIEDASYLRLKNVQLGYTFPTPWMEKMRVSKLRLYVSGDNLFTKTDFFYGYDPEVPVGNTGGYYPQVKTFIVGLNLNLK